MCNLKRRYYERRSPPCEKCPISAFSKVSGCMAYSELSDCHWYAGWLKRNEAKKSLANVVDQTGHFPLTECSHEMSDNKELLSHIME